MNGALMFLGAGLLLAVGYGAAQWRARSGKAKSKPKPSAAGLAPGGGTTCPAVESLPAPVQIERFAAAMDRFHRWLTAQAEQVDQWPSFGEFVRSVLNECCGATHVKIYRVSSNGKELRALNDSNPFVQTDLLSARRGILGHVVTSGRSYIAGDVSQGKLIETLAEGVEGQIAWCFPIQRGAERLGVVMAGQCPPWALANKPVLALAEKLIAQLWLMAAGAERTRALEQYDPICGLLSRPSFVKVAEQALRDAYSQGAPVAMAVLALEGLRGMNDCGRWEIADELLRELSALLRVKVRSEDVLGRFDGSRFVILLRSVDSELATLIVRQLIAQLSVICGDSARWGAATQLRCGLTGSGTRQPTLRTLVSQALNQTQRARVQNRLIAADVFEHDLAETSA